MFDLTPTATPNARTVATRRAARAKNEVTVTDYAEIDGVGQGLLSSGEPFVTQRGLAALCGVQNAHIGTISRDWDSAKPRILAIRARLGFKRAAAHRVLTFEGRRLYAYDAPVAEAVLNYYAHDAGSHAQPEAARALSSFSQGGLKAGILTRFAAPSAPAQPIRFVPVEADAEEDVHAVTAFLVRIWSLYVLSFWMAVNHLDELRQKVAAAPWNRLGLYLPLKAIIEMQAEIVRRNASLGFR